MGVLVFCIQMLKEKEKEKEKVLFLLSFFNHALEITEFALKYVADG